MHYDVVIIGTGFGGSMTALSLAERTFGTGRKILMLERGTWWTTPVSTVQDKEVAMYAFLRAKDQPVQFWSSQNHFRGFLDLITRCFRRTRDSSLLARWFRGFRNEDGLLETDWFGRRGLFRKGDGVLVARSCGVGGGSLIYSNITIRPPDFVLNGPRWPTTWTTEERHYYYDFARQAIGEGVVLAVREREAKGLSTGAHPDRVTAEIENYVPGQSLAVKQFDPGSKTWSQLSYAITAATTQGIEDDLRKGRHIWLDLDRTSTPPTIGKIVPHGGFRINTGLSNILTRTARFSTYHGRIGEGDPFNPRGIARLDDPPAPAPPPPPPPLPPLQPAPPDPNVPQDPLHALWLNRARVFQIAMGEMTSDFGAVDLAINDVPADDKPLATNGKPKNYCERQGRCNIGCLPGARHTLNKQLARAALGAPPDRTWLPDKQPHFPNLEISALSEVDLIRELQNGGYEIEYERQGIENYRDQEAGKARRRVEKVSVTADVVVLSAGTLGTNEIMLRSKLKGTLPGLSNRTGYGFSPNGDFIAFMEPTKERVDLIKGPVTTSFGHFETDKPGTGAGGPGGGPGNEENFHTVEDQGIPPSTASLLGEALPLTRSLARGNTGYFLVVCAIMRYTWKVIRRAFRDLFRNAITRGQLFLSEEELASNKMAVAVMGRDAADATLRLGTHPSDSRLRASKPGGKTFWEDPIYTHIRATLERLAGKLGDPATAKFENPFLSPAAKALKTHAIATSHPLGGCIMARAAAEGTVDEFGRPFDVRSGEGTGVYRGLYVADGSIVPSALGVNPSLTIAALALRIGDKIYEEHFAT